MPRSATSTTVATTDAIGTEGARRSRRTGCSIDRDRDEAIRAATGRRHRQHARIEDVVLEDADDEKRAAGKRRDVPRDRQPGAGCEHDADQRPDDRDDLEDREAIPRSSQYGSPTIQNEPEISSAANVISSNSPRTNAPRRLIDQLPGIADLPPLRPSQQARDQVDGAVPLEDPVGGGREREQDPDEYLQRLSPIDERRVRRAGRRKAGDSGVAATRRAACSLKPARRDRRGLSARRRAPAAPASIRSSGRRTRGTARRARAPRGSGEGRRPAAGSAWSRATRSPGRIAAAMIKREEEQRNYDAQLPQRERADDGRDRDRRRDQRAQRRAARR